MVRRLSCKATGGWLLKVASHEVPTRKLKSLQRVIHSAHCNSTHGHSMKTNMESADPLAYYFSLQYTIIPLIQCLVSNFVTIYSLLASQTAITT